MQEGTSQRATCTVLEEFLMSQFENYYAPETSQPEEPPAPETSQPEEPPDVSVLDNVVFNMSSEEVDRTLSQIESSTDQRSYNRAVQKLLTSVQESGNNEIPSGIKDGQFPSATKILPVDDSLEKESEVNMEAFGNTKILNMTTKQTKVETFDTFSSGQLANQCTEGEEDVLAAVTIGSRTSTRSTEEQEVVTPSPEKSMLDYFLKSVHQIDTAVTNDDATDKYITSVHMLDHFETGSLVQNDTIVENNGTTHTSQMPCEENFIPLTSVITSELQPPSLFFARKIKSVPAKVSFVPPSSETNPSEPLPFQAQVQQDMLVPSEQSQFYGFSPDHPKVIIGYQKCGGVHSSPAQAGSGNLQIPPHICQSLHSGTGKSSIPTSWCQTFSADNSPRLPPDKSQCSSYTISRLKMKLKKKTTGERHQPYKDQRPINDLLPKFKELINTPF